MPCSHTEAQSLKPQVKILHMYNVLKKIHSCFISPYAWSMHQMLPSIKRPNKSISHKFWLIWGGKKHDFHLQSLSFSLLIEPMTLGLLAPDREDLHPISHHRAADHQSHQQGHPWRRRKSASSKDLAPKSKTEAGLYMPVFSSRFFQSDSPSPSQDRVNDRGKRVWRAQECYINRATHPRKVSKVNMSITHKHSKP